MAENICNMPGPGPDSWPSGKVGPQKWVEPSPIMKKEMMLGLKFLHEQNYSKSFVVSPSSIARVQALYQSGILEKQDKPLINANLIADAYHVFCKDANQTPNIESSSISIIDFHTNPAMIINEKISIQTKLAIQKLVNAKDIPNDLDTLLASALYFKTAFRGKREFPTISRKVFYKKASQKRQQEYWSIANFATTFQDEDFEVYSSKYILGSDFKFSVFCPKKDFNLSNAAKILDADRVRYLLNQTEETMIVLHIPIIQLESKIRVQDAINIFGDEFGEKNVKIAHGVAVKFDKLKLCPSGPKVSRASKSLFSGDDEMPHIYSEFTANQPFIWTISKGDDLVLMGYYC